MKAKTVKGFEDYTGEEARKREKIIEVLKKNFNLYGFKPVETPVIEKEGFVKQGNEQDEAVSDVYKLRDKGKRKLALRYEFTFQLKRIAKNKKLPYKRYQIGPVFRDEPVKSNRFRQFKQADVDVVGSDIRNEAEILKLSQRIFNDLNLEVEININNRKMLNEILEEQKVKKKEEVIRIIDKLDKKKEKQIKKELKKYKCENILEIFKNKEEYFEKYKAYSEIAELKDYCQAFNVKVKFQPSLARGLSYYNGSVFEIKTKGMKETIAGGGSFLVNKKNSAGISFGIERLSQLAKVDSENQEVLIISIKQDEEAINLAEKLRSENINTCIFYDKVSKGLEYANSKGIKKVIFVGKDEIKKRKFKVRDMKTGKEELLTIEKLVKYIKNQ